MTFAVGLLQDFVRLLLAHGCNATATAMDDMNALHFAAQKGHTEIARHLLNAGQSQNTPDKGATLDCLMSQLAVPMTVCAFTMVKCTVHVPARE